MYVFKAVILSVLSDLNAEVQFAHDFETSNVMTISEYYTNSRPYRTGFVLDITILPEYLHILAQCARNKYISLINKNEINRVLGNLCALIGKTSQDNLLRTFIQYSLPGIL